MTRETRNDCPECVEGLSRRDFVRAVGAAAATTGLIPWAGAGRARAAGAKPSPDAPAETAARRLYESLSDEQRKSLCFPFDHPLRKRINANWAITESTIDDLTPEQQQFAREVFKGVTSPDGYERFMKQMDDDYGGFEQYHIALFGSPNNGGVEWELTGRHMTIRADGDSVSGAAFGGPIVYGHGAGDGEKGLPGNVFYYQTQKANEVFAALDGKQREKALISQAPSESAVAIQGSSGSFPGIAVGELSGDQKELVEKVMRVVLAPYREQDVDEAMAFVKEGGGLDALHMAFYETDNLGDDQEWDIWRLEGPTFVWHFRGAPHVHAYVNVGKKS